MREGLSYTVTTRHSWLHAATVGDVQTLRRLLRRHPDIAECRDNVGDTALHRAAAHGRILAVRALCDIAPQLLHLLNKEQRLAEHCALRNGQAECVRYLSELSQAAAIEARLQTYSAGGVHHRHTSLQPLHYAALHGDIEAADYILRRNPRAIQACGLQTPAHLAAESGFPRFVLFMRETDPAALTRKDARGRTPAHRALYAGQDKTLRVLIRFAPEMLDAKDICDCTVADSADMRGRHTLARFLRKRGEHFAFRARLQAYAARAAKEIGRHVLDIAAEAGDIRAMRLILARYPHLPAYEDAARRALTACSTRGDVATARMLFTKFPLLSRYIEQDGAPLRAAAASGKADMVRMLLNIAPSSVSTKDRYGNTALHEAARHGHRVVAGLCLYHRKSSALETNRFGATPAHVAAHHGHASVLELCEKHAPASLTVHDNDGWNAADYASHADKPACLTIAQRCGCIARRHNPMHSKENRRFIIRRTSR